MHSNSINSVPKSNPRSSQETKWGILPTGGAAARYAATAAAWPPPAGAGAGAGAGALDTGAPDVAAAFGEYLATFPGGCSKAQLDAHLQDFYGDLAYQDSLTPATVKKYSHQLAVRLQELGYSGPCQAEIVRSIHAHQKDLRKREHEEEAAYHAVQSQGGAQHPGEYYSIDDTTVDAHGNPEPPERRGIYRRTKGGSIRLSNFTFVIHKDVFLQDAFETKRFFEGTVTLLGKPYPIRVGADVFADSKKLLTAIYTAAGPQVQIYGSMETLRTAISALSPKPISKRLTTDFGWTPECDRYLVHGGSITAVGYQPVGAGDELQVDLQDEENAAFLGMRPLEPAELVRVKTHLVQDFLQMHDPRVMYSLLGAVGAAVLFPFADGVGRFGLWLMGLTGSGKSYAAKLAMNFFGDFPVGAASGRIAFWTGTANFLQRLGYFFKDALYLIDDYKPETTPQWQAVRLLQNYADGTGRGRLKQDATANVTRHIRGLLVSTGEDIPEHSASTTARNIVIRVPESGKDLQRGRRCTAESPNYSGVTADFIHHVLHEGRQLVFGRMVKCLQDRYAAGVMGQQNDLRVAANFAVLGAAFVEMAFYLKDVWPGWKAAVKWFLNEALPELRDEMLAEAREQQASEVFLATLQELIEHNLVTFLGSSHSREDTAKVIGKSHSGIAVSPNQELYLISTGLAMAEVQTSLARQGKSKLQITDRTLIDQLHQSGKIADANGNPLAPGAKATTQARLGGNPKQCFRTYLPVLCGQFATVAELLAQNPRLMPLAGSRTAQAAVASSQPVQPVQPVQAAVAASSQPVKAAVAGSQSVQTMAAGSQPVQPVVGSQPVQPVVGSQTTSGNQNGVPGPGPTTV